MGEGIDRTENERCFFPIQVESDGKVPRALEVGEGQRRSSCLGGRLPLAAGGCERLSAMDASIAAAKLDYLRFSFIQRVTPKLHIRQPGYGRHGDEDKRSAPAHGNT
jgi:hypothetical protein